MDQQRAVREPPLAIGAGLIGTDPSYTYWNVGLAITYKTVTVDLRYHGTDQSVADCNSFLLVTPGNRFEQLVQRHLHRGPQAQLNPVGLQVSSRRNATIQI